jgi:hypothetical protein
MDKKNNYRSNTEPAGPKVLMLDLKFTVRLKVKKSYVTLDVYQNTSDTYKKKKVRKIGWPI